MRRSLALVTLLAATLLAGLLAAPAAGASTCATGWGSTPKSAAALSAAPVTAVRAGRTACYDRLVFDLAGPAGGYQVAYVDQVLAEGSGAVVPTPGGARLQVTLHDPAPTRPGLPGVGGYPTLRSVTWAGSFEGYTTVGVGVRARLPFRVFTLTGPDRLVLDVADAW